MISNLLRRATGADSCTQDLFLIGGFGVEKLRLGHSTIAASYVSDSTFGATVMTETRSSW